MNANIENRNQNPQNPNPHAENYARDTREDEDDVQEQREERRAIIEERERMVKSGELIKLTFTPDLSKPSAVFVRYYDPYHATRHYVLTNGRHKDD